MAFILIVDDDPDFAEAVATTLRGDGHETLVEADPERVPGHLAGRLPDLVILDVMFPEDPTGGFELARAIGRAHGALPVLMLTAVNEQYPLGFSARDIDPAWMPVRDFLEKPVEFDVLRARVRQLLARDAAVKG